MHPLQAYAAATISSSSSSKKSGVTLWFRTTPWHTLAAYVVGALALAWVLASSFHMSERATLELAGLTLPQMRHQQMYAREVLVMYIFAASDPEFLNNLKYFIREAVSDDSRCDYVIVVQGSPELQKDLPVLPKNAKYVFHANECYDWGTFGWLLESGHVQFTKYKYFVFMNCSVRGPFMPAYARGKMHWTHPFIKRLQGDIKLVGPTISCEGSPLNGDMEGRWRRNPHVQSYVVATDRIGLDILIDDGKIFHCHNNRWNTIYYSELGSSAAILAAGYNIDSFMTRYQGVDWRNKRNWDCNTRYSPQGEHFYDGITIDPLEVMFVKVKSFTLQNDLSMSKKAAKYELWHREPLQPVNLTLLLGNEYLAQLPKYKVPKILEMKARSGACFDFAFYSAHNADLKGLRANEVLWKHYVFFGQFESRPHKFTCPMDYDRIANAHF